jgi:hypothetical protein
MFIFEIQTETNCYKSKENINQYGYKGTKHTK